MSEQSFMEVMEELEAEGIVRAALNPAYGGCDCSCHEPNPFMLTEHCIPCCYPMDDLLYDFRLEDQLWQETM